MPRSRSTTIATPLGVVLAAAIATPACMTPSQSRSMRSQLGEIRQQVDTLHEQQSQNGSAIREVAARADRPRRASRQERPVQIVDGSWPNADEAVVEEVPDDVSSSRAPAAAPRPGALYRRGYVLFHQGEFVRAEEALGSFLLAEPYSPYAENARYWIGECRYARGLYRESIEAFREVIDRHPGGGKGSHALYKIALSFDRLGEAGGMQEALQDLLERFPESDVAPLARSRLGGT